MMKITSRAERIDRSDPAHNYHETIERFTAHLMCETCGETGTLAGNYYTHWIPDGSDEGYTDLGYQALSIVPAPLPFRIHRPVPLPVEEIVREAAALFWADQKAAASRVREALEAVLTDLGVATHSAGGGRLSLHRRVELFRSIDAEKWKEQAEIIEAAKWIGNDGTHDTITREDALDAFEMLEAVLDDVYVRRRHSLLEKARAMNLSRKKRPQDA